MFGLPFFAVANVSLYSKITDERTQGMSITTAQLKKLLKTLLNLSSKSPGFDLTHGKWAAGIFYRSHYTGQSTGHHATDKYTSPKESPSPNHYPKFV